MKRILLFLSAISLSAVCLAQDATVNDPVPLAPKDYRRPAGYDPDILWYDGEGIYATRTYSTISEGKIRYTRSKDSRTVYAITLEWPGDRVELKAVTPAADSKVYMLGYKEPLKWHVNDGTTTIELPAKLQKEGNRPCKYAYTFRIERE